jgi:hypothetical protein
VESFHDSEDGRVRRRRGHVLRGVLLLRAAEFFDSD